MPTSNHLAGLSPHKWAGDNAQLLLRAHLLPEAGRHPRAQLFGKGSFQKGDSYIYFWVKFHFAEHVN